MDQYVNMLPIAEQAARAGGEQLRHWRRNFRVKEKGRFDLVTDADHAAQHAVYQVITTAFPDHHFLGEETPKPERDTIIKTSKPLWVVDPLDGTTNYVHDVPSYAVSIGLVVEGIVQVGVIYDPSRDEMFSAVKGHGTTLNGQPLRCTQSPNLGETLISIGFPPNLRGNEYVVEAWKWFGYECQGLRRTGSSAINLAYVAAGRFDGFFAFQISPWDVAGGIVLVEEAGGIVTHADGRRYDPLVESTIVASNGPLHPELLRGLKAVIP
jgi:myo-inositol-1(or 4)-monophosphatase